MRIAFKLAYLGNYYSGFQFQPNVPTVEGELFKAFKSLEIDYKNSYKSAGRTDSGAHAFGQVIAVNCDSKLKLTPRKINCLLPEYITIWAWSRVGEDFNPRHAQSRIYSYAMLAKNLNISVLRKGAKLLIGTHDFTNFTKKFGEGKSCVRTIKSAEARLDGDFLLFEIEGNAFTWNMVRCIVSALEAVGSEHRSIDWFEMMLDPDKHRERIEPAPPYGLILKDVKYSGIKFEVDDYAWRTLQKRVFDLISFHGSIYRTFSGLIE